MAENPRLQRAPYGSCNGRTPGLVAAAGFRGGLTTRHTNFWAALEQLTGGSLHGATEGLIGEPAGDGYRLIDRGGLARRGAGCRLAAADRGIFPFGNAPGYGSGAI